MLYLTNVYGAKFGASALAANGLLRYLVGGSFPLFTIPSESYSSASISAQKQLTIFFYVYNNLTFPWASSLLAFLAVAFAFLPWIFYMFGSKVRGTSAYIT